jgi:hypothetical protein
MTQITGAIIGITLVLVAVFIPMAFFPGSVGVIYRQFLHHHGVGDRVFRVPRAVAHAGTVRDLAQSRSRPATSTRAGDCSACSTGEWIRPRRDTAGSCAGRSCAPVG